MTIAVLAATFWFHPEDEVLGDAATPDTMTDVLDLLSKHAWVPLAALIINFIVRQLKSDAPLPINVSPRVRPWIAFGLGIVSGVLQAIITGTKPAEAIVGGLISAMMAVFTNETVVSSIRDSKEFMPKIPWPWSPKPSSIKPPPPPAAGAGGAMMILIVFLCSGCVGNFEEARSASAHVALGVAPPVRDQVHCNSLDGDHTLFIRGAWASGTIAAGAGIAAGALSGNDPTTTGWRQGLAITAAVGGAMAVASTIEANNAAQNWAADCSGADPIPAPVPLSEPTK